MTPTGERVRQAALELFAERGFHGTGIRQLAERAGVSSASLYHYMGTKEDLLVALMTSSLEGQAAGVLDLEHPALARRALLEMCSGVARWFDQAGPLSLADLADHYVALACRLLGVSRATRRGGAVISA